MNKEKNILRKNWNQTGGSGHEGGTHKFEQERVFPERADASGKSEDEHYPPYHDEEPYRVETAQICDGGNV